MTRGCVVIGIGLAMFWLSLPGSVRAQAAGGTLANPVPVETTAGHMQMRPLSDAAELEAAEAPAPLQRPEDLPLSLSVLAPGRSLRPTMRETWAVPRLRWDDHPEGARWTAAVLGALRGPGAPLLDVVPRDIGDWCPGYPAGDDAQRAAFWAGLVSALAWHESTHSPEAVGGGGQWFGLVQIAPGTARWRNCAVRSGQALLDWPANLRCGIRIMAATVPRDGVVAEGMRGVAADWGPFHSTRKREDMRNWVRGQEYCLPRTRPVARPASLLAAGPDGRGPVGPMPQRRPIQPLPPPATEALAAVRP